MAQLSLDEFLSSSGSGRYSFHFDSSDNSRKRKSWEEADENEEENSYLDSEDFETAVSNIPEADIKAIRAKGVRAQSDREIAHLLAMMRYRNPSCESCGFKEGKSPS